MHTASKKLISGFLLALPLVFFVVASPANAIDVTAPSSVTYVYDGLANFDGTTVYTPTSISANWDTSTDLESGVVAYWYSVGTTPGASNVVIWTDNGTATSVTAMALSLTQSITYYVSVKAENGDGLFSTATTSNGQVHMYDATGPDVTLVTVYDGLVLGTDDMYASSTTTLSAIWDIPYESESGILAYWYAIGTATGATDVMDWTDNGAASMMDENALSLSEATTYYVSMKSQNLSEVYSNVVSSDGVTIDTIAPTDPAYVYDMDMMEDVDFASSSTFFGAYWATSTDATSDIYSYYYAFGSSPGATDVIDWQSAETMTSVTPFLPGGYADGMYYASIYAMDGAKNKSSVVVSDGVYLDTMVPQIINNQPPANTWLNADAGILYDVDFSDTGSGLNDAYYSVYDGPSMSGTNTVSAALIDYGYGAASMATDWPVDFATLSEGISYVSVMTYDMAANPAYLMDAFTILKDTMPPTGATLNYTTGYVTYTDILNTFSFGTDDTSGIYGSSILRREAPLQVGLCDAYGSWGIVNASPSVSSWNDTSVTAGYCYQYELEVVDNASNSAYFCTDGTDCLAPYVAMVSSTGGSIDCQIYNDISQNGLVNLVDLAILLRNFGTSGTPDCYRGDVNLDGNVNLSDLATIKPNFHTTYGFQTGAPTPEIPATLANPAMLSLSSSANSIQIGNTITVDVTLDPTTGSYYGVDVFLSYATDVYSISSVDTTISGISEMYNSFSTDTGIISFTVYNASPSISGTPAIVGTITLNVIADATGTIDFISDIGVDMYTAALADGTFNATSTPLYVDVSLGAALTLGPDNTPPTDIAAVYDSLGADIDFSSSTTSVDLNWTASSDPESGISLYLGSVGTSPGATDTAAWDTIGVSNTYSYMGLTLSHGMTYYVNVQAQNNAGGFSAVTSSDGFTVDTTAPTGTTYVSAFMDSFTYEITVNWDEALDSESGIYGYYYAIGSATATPSDVVPWTLGGPATATSFMAALTDGVEYYASIKSLNNAGIYSSEITSSYPFLYDSSVPVGPTYIFDGNGADIDYATDTSMLEANWDSISDPDSDISYVRYAIGTSQGTDDIQAWTDISPATSVQVTGLTLSDGITYYFSVKGVNGVLSEGIPAYSDGVTIDITAPSTVTVSDGLSTDIDSATSTTSISGNWTTSTDAGSGIVRYWYSVGTAIGTTDVVSWTDSGINQGAPLKNFTETVMLIEGMTYYVNVKAEDNAGNFSTIATSDGVTITGTPPTSTVTSPASGARLNAVTAISGTATDTAGSGISAVYISIMRSSDSQYWDDVLKTWSINQAWLMTTGTTSWTISSGFPTWADGISYTIQSKAVGSTGAVETPGTGITFTFDTTGPTINVTSPVSGSITGTASASVAGTTESGATLTVNGVSVTVNTNGSFSTTVTLTEGSNSISLISTDTAGNTGSSTVPVSLDTTNPTATISSPSAGATVSSTITIIGTASDANFQGYSLEFGYGSAPPSWGYITSGSATVSSGTLGTFDTTYLGGNYTIKLTVYDTAGNSSESMVAVTIQNTVSLSFTAPAGEWSLISLPMAPDTATAAKLTASANLWTFWWNPTAVSDPKYAQYVQPTTVTAGQGLWITPKSETTDVSVTLSGTVVDMGGAESYDYDIESGWNMIGTPFSMNMMWQYMYVKSGGSEIDIPTAVSGGLIESTPFYYDGTGWRQLTQDASPAMIPGTGYFLYAPTSAQISLVYYPYMVGAGRISGKIIKTSPVMSFSISAESASAKDLDNIIALSTSASDGYDYSDLREPPGAFGKYISLYFPHDKWEKNAGRYTNDTRSVTGVDSGCTVSSAGICKRWSFNVDTNDTGNISLSWPDLSEYEGAFDIKLIDGSTKTDMTNKTSYSYAAATSKSFTVELSRKAPAMKTVIKEIKKGWNLISIPVDPSITAAAAHLADNLENLNIFQLYNGRLIGGTDSEGVDIQAGLGYWLYSDADTTIDIEGFPVDFLLPVEIPLTKGWNLLGNPYEDSMIWGDNIKLLCDGNELSLKDAIASGKISSDIFIRDSNEKYVKKGHGDSIDAWTGFFVNIFVEKCSIHLRK